MGLDQFAYEIKEGQADNEGTEICYWRKHNRLQGYMELLWREDLSNDGEFNCENVELTIEDLDVFEQAINDRCFPETDGFFFGNDSYEEYDGEHGYKSTDLEFIEKARKALNNGNRVIYTSWW